MKKINLLFLLLLLFACKSEKQKLTDQIQSNEKKLFNDNTKMLNLTVASEELKAYRDFVTKFPDDTASMEYLFKAADLAHGMRKNRDAIDLYKTFIEKYPNNEKVQTCLFLQAFIYDSELKQKDTAKIYYKQFLEKYPKGTLAPSAQASLDQIESGMTDEQLVKMFEAKLDSAKNKEN